MRKENVEKMRRMLVRAINAHLQQGGKLVCGSFVRGENTYCPITCLLGGNNTSTGDGKSYAKCLSEKLGFSLTDEEMWQFIYGFDNSGYSKTAMFKMGKSLRSKYFGRI